MSPEALGINNRAIEQAESSTNPERGEGINDNVSAEKYALSIGEKAKEAALALRKEMQSAIHKVEGFGEVDQTDLDKALSDLSAMDEEAEEIANEAEKEILSVTVTGEKVGETTAGETSADNLTREVQSGRMDPDIRGDGTGAGTELAPDASIDLSTLAEKDEVLGNANSADDAFGGGQFLNKSRQDELGTSVNGEFQADQPNEARGEPKPEEIPKPTRKDNLEEGIEEDGKDEKNENLRAIDDELNELDGQYEDVVRKSRTYMSAENEYTRAHGVNRFNTYLLRRSNLELQRQMIVQGVDAPEARIQVTEEFIRNQQYKAAVDKAGHHITDAENALKIAESSVKKYEEDLGYERSTVPRRAEAVKELQAQMDRDPNNEQLHRVYVKARRVYSETVTEIREMEAKLRVLQEEKIPGYQEQVLSGREELERIKTNPEQYSQVPDTMQGDPDYRRCMEKAGTWASQDSEAFERRMGYNQQAKALGHFKRACPDKFYFYRRREGFDESEDEYCDLQSQYRDTEDMSNEEVQELASHTKALVDRYNQLSQGDNVDRKALVKVAEEDLSRYERDIYKRQQRKAQESRMNVEDNSNAGFFQQREAEMTSENSEGDGRTSIKEEMGEVADINRGGGETHDGQRQPDVGYPDPSSRVDDNIGAGDSYQEMQEEGILGQTDFRKSNGGNRQDVWRPDKSRPMLTYDSIPVPDEPASENAGSERSVDNLNVTAESLRFFDALADELDIFSSQGIGINEKVRAISRKMQHLSLPIRINYDLNQKPISINIIKLPADGGFAIEATGYDFEDDKPNVWRIGRNGGLLGTDTNRERQLNEIINQLAILRKRRSLQSVVT